MSIPAWLCRAVLCLCLCLGLGCGSDGNNGNGGDGGSPGTGGGSMFACDYANYGGSGSHWCWTWDASNFPMPGQLITAYQMACTQGMGTAVAACSTSGAVGKCSFTSTSGSYMITQTIFYYAPIDRSSAMQACMAQGSQGVTATWTSL